MVLFLLLLLGYNPQTLAVPPKSHTFGFYRASKHYLQLFLGPSYNYSDPQGITAVKLKELDNPKTKKDDDELSVFAVNAGYGHIVYNVGLEAVKTWGGAKELSQPKGIVANDDGFVYVADFGNGRVVKLRYEGGRLRKMRDIPVAGRPYDVDLDSKNNLYVTDFDNSRVYIYSDNDSLIGQFGYEGIGFGELSAPMGIAVIDAVAKHNHHQDDFIVITDRGGMRVSKFTTGGRFLGSVNNYDLGLTDARFLYAAIDYFGNIYVTDEVNDQIHKFDHGLKYIISQGRTGTSRGEYIAPRGISIWRRYGQVFITEREGGQYLWIAADAFVVGSFPDVFTARQPGSTLALYVTDEAKINISVYDRLGGKVRDLIDGMRRPVGEFLVVWDGLDNQGNLVAPGDYEYQIRLRSLHGHGRRLEKIIKAGVKCSVL